MSLRGLVIFWIAVVTLSAWQLHFALSDWFDAEEMTSFRLDNPFRPSFRVAFGGVMVILLNATAAAVTFRVRRHHPLR